MKAIKESDETMKTIEYTEAKLETTIGKAGYEPATITIAVKDRGIVLKESSMLLIHKESTQITAIGNEAEQHMQDTESVSSQVVAINPLRRGIIANYAGSVAMFRHYIKKALECSDTSPKRHLCTRLKKPCIIICIPEPLTEVEQKAFQDCFYQAGAKKVMLTALPLEQVLPILSEIPGHYTVIIGITWPAA